MGQYKLLWITIILGFLLTLALAGCVSSGGDGDDGGGGQEIVQEPPDDPIDDPVQDPVQEPVVQGVMPVPGSQLSNTETFSWNSVPDATEYWVHLGTTVFGQDICCSFTNGDATSITISGIPQGGGTIFLRIWYFLDGAWESDDFTYGGDGGIAQCDDGIDNDGDGLADLDDPGCAFASDNDETDTTLPPGDGTLIDEPIEFQGFLLDNHEVFIGDAGFCFLRISVTEIDGAFGGAFCNYLALDSILEQPSPNTGAATFGVTLGPNETLVIETGIGLFGDLECREIDTLEFLGCTITR